MRYFLFWILAGWLIVACQTEPPTPPLVTEQTAAVVLPSPTVTPTETPVPPTTTPVPTSTQTATPISSTETPISEVCIHLIYEEYAQFEIVALTGQRILVDVYDPERLSNPVSADDILLTSHTHWDHFDPEFQAAFPGAQLFLQAEKLDFPGGSIQGIASAHNAEDSLKPEGGTNYIYLIEIGDLRIAHFGDIGQNKLTNEQLTALGEIDLALTQLNNPYSEMNAENKKGIHLIEQYQPRLVIPTHLNLDTVKAALGYWTGFYAQNPNIKICKSDLRENSTQILLMGDAVETMVNYVELDQWKIGDR